MSVNLYNDDVIEFIQKYMSEKEIIVLGGYEMIKIERVLLWLELFNKKYNTDFIISDLNGQKECTYKQFKRYKEKCYSYLIKKEKVSNLL